MPRVGVIGLGYWGPNIVRNLAASSKWEITAIVDLSNERLEKLGKLVPKARRENDFCEVADDVDAVIIATPPETHADLARSALELGKHVLVEKPLTTDAMTARAIATLADRKGLVLAVDHTFLYTGAVEFLKRSIENSMLGELYGMDSVRVNLGLYQHYASVYVDLAAHDISIFNFLLDDVPTHVAAISLQLVNESYSDVAYITLKYGSGIHAHIHVSWLSPIKVRRLSIMGSKRMALWDDVEPSEKVRVYDKGVDFQASDDARIASFISYRAGDMHAPALDNREALGKVVDDFANAITNGQPMRSSARGGVAVVDVLDAVKRSAAAGGIFVAVHQHE